MNKILNMTYESSLSNLCEVNSSFDSGVFKICYTGENRNGSYISKETFQRCMKTIYNCPIVCAYDRETDSLGGHEVELIRENGGYRIVNATYPVGVVPESAKVWFEEDEDENGIIHDYLCADALIWKRQEAYEKIKRDGIVSQSMEIKVKDSETKDGVYYINDFEFNAFALIGVEPCYEGAALQVYELDKYGEGFETRFSEMMNDMKNATSSLQQDDDVNNNSEKAKGGENDLKNQEKDTAKNEGLKDESSFALLSGIRDELERAIYSVKVERGEVECERYFIFDVDIDEGEVYCWDITDWILYGFTFSLDGDKVVVDFDSKKRKKIAVVDFDEGSTDNNEDGISAQIQELYSAKSEYTLLSSKAKDMEEELSNLRKFKKETEAEKENLERESVLEKFSDLSGMEEFECLKDNLEQFDLVSLEEKCFAIRGKNIKNFSLDNKAPKLKIDKNSKANEPYGGIFAKYGVMK